MKQAQIKIQNHYDQGFRQIWPQSTQKQTQPTSQLEKKCYFSLIVSCVIFSDTEQLYPVDTGRKMNVHKTFRIRPGRLLNFLCTFNLRPVSTGYLMYPNWSMIYDIIQKGNHQVCNTYVLPVKRERS